jgi:hypothetical protein
MALEREMKEQGQLVASVRLRHRSEAMTLRNLANGKRRLVNGPFADTEEAWGGYYILECASMDEALAWAERMPNYGHGSIEIRPFWE